MEQSLASARLVAPSILGRSWRLAAIIAVSVVVVFGALAQVGIIIPSFGSQLASEGSTGAGDAYSVVSVNSRSWRAWKVTAEFSNGADAEPFAGGILRVTLSRAFRAGAMTDPARMLTVQPGHQFQIEVTLEHGSCGSGFNSGIETAPNPPPLINVPVLLAVGTPLGAKTIAESVGIDCPSDS